MSISVVIPYYNSLNSIYRSLESIKKQTLLPEEVIIVDDCSNVENSINTTNIKSSDYPFRVEIVKHKINLGAATARNSGIRVSKGDYIAFLDSDDCWETEKLELQLKYINDFDLLYTNYSEQKINIILDTQPCLKIITYFDILKKNLSPVTLFVKKNSILFFDERFRRCDDFKMSIEALINNKKIGYLDINLSYGFKRAIGEGGLTKSITKMSFSYLKACFTLIAENKKYILNILPFIIFEILKFPIRYLKVAFRK
jgi:glycosyltransferase involved in cell wall biosynthesis